MPGDVTAHGSQRIRASKPKTRTGCVTCKIRRVKCDEGKPVCQRCSIAGIVCGGYKKLSAPTTSRLATRPAITSHHTLIATPIAPRPFSGTQAEQRSFYYFSQETIPQLCGIHQSHFWLRYVLQACVDSPAIRHAAIAVGSMHEQFSAGFLAKLGPSQDLEAEQFALQQYNTAIHLLLQPVSSKHGHINVDVALITCVLFTCFEVIRHQLSAALAHIDGAVKILSELRSQNDTSQKRILKTRSIPYAPLSILSQVFTRLDLQASGWVKERPARLVHNFREQTASHSLKVPSQFAGLREAGNALESILSPWLRNWQIATKDGARRPTKGHLALVSSAYRYKLSQWRIAFNKLYAQLAKHKLPSAATQVICLIQLHYTIMYIHANIDHDAASTDETLWDVYKPEFQLMVDYATGILTTSSPTSDSSKQMKSKRLFSLDIGILAPLSFIASRCREPQIRRAAISLIRNANRKEGFWTSEAAAERAQNTMEIEEAGMNIDTLEGGLRISREKRVVGCITVMDGDGAGGGKAVFHYVRPPPEGEEESLEWSVRNDVPDVRASDMKRFRFSTLEGCGIIQTIYWRRYAKFLQGCP